MICLAKNLTTLAKRATNDCFCRVYAAHTHQTTPTVDHVLFAHVHMQVLLFDIRGIVE